MRDEPEPADIGIDTRTLAYIALKAKAYDADKLAISLTDDEVEALQTPDTETSIDCGRPETR